MDPEDATAHVVTKFSPWVVTSHKLTRTVLRILHTHAIWINWSFCWRSARSRHFNTRWHCRQQPLDKLCNPVTTKKLNYFPQQRKPVSQNPKIPAPNSFTFIQLHARRKTCWKVTWHVTHLSPRESGWPIILHWGLHLIFVARAFGDKNLCKLMLTKKRFVALVSAGRYFLEHIVSGWSGWLRLGFVGGWCHRNRICIYDIICLRAERGRGKTFVFVLNVLSWWHPWTNVMQSVLENFLWKYCLWGSLLCSHLYLNRIHNISIRHSKIL